MVTLYIDVYFLINFTVDLLSVFFAVKLTKIFVSTVKIVTAAGVGALQAVIYILFFENRIFGLIFSIVYFSFLSIFICRGLPAIRKIKFTLAFCLIETLVGGTVYYLYGILESHLDMSGESLGTENRNLLILSLMILLSVGVIKLSINVLSSAKNEKVARLQIEYKNTKTELDCFVDSGNLALDPIDSTPAAFLSQSAFLRIFGIGALPDEQFNNLLRIIPVKRKNKTEIYYGIKYDGIYLLSKNKREKTNLILVIGDEVSYGGYEALIPFSAVSR